MNIICIKKNIYSFFCFIIRIEGFPLAAKFVLSDKLVFLARKMRICENWTLGAEVSGQAGPPSALRRQE